MPPVRLSNDWMAKVGDIAYAVANLNIPNILSWRYFWIKWYVDSRARAQTERGNTRGGATKKREISRNLLSINLNFSVQCTRVRPKQDFQC